MGLHLVGIIFSAMAGRLALTDIGTAAMLGGVLGEVYSRLWSLLGWEPVVDGWREGMFFGALFFLALWAFGVMEA